MIPIHPAPAPANPPGRREVVDPVPLALILLLATTGGTARALFEWLVGVALERHSGESAIPFVSGRELARAAPGFCAN